MTTTTKQTAARGYMVVIAAGHPARYGPKSGWDTIWPTPEDAEACAARARRQDGWEARVIEIAAIEVAFLAEED